MQGWEPTHRPLPWRPDGLPVPFFRCLQALMLICMCGAAAGGLRACYVFVSVLASKALAGAVPPISGTV